MIQGRKLEERQRVAAAAVATYRTGVQVTPGGGGRVESSVASLQQHQQRRMAPLASLDCSITEPLDQVNQNPHQTEQQHQRQRPSPVETPTLSGYFDCDQLSDMVDGSLFEITYAGCLSKTVFNYPTSTTERNLHQHLMGETSKVSSSEVDANSADHQPSTIDSNSGNKTPTNDLAQQQQLQTALDEQSIAVEKPKSQLELLANYQPYDYSSTSRVPAQTRQSNQQQPSNGCNVTNTAGSHRHRSAARHSAQRSQVASSSRSQPLSHTTNSTSTVAKRSSSSSHRKSRSNPDMRDSGGGSSSSSSSISGNEQSGAAGLCSTCREQEVTLKNKKEKKRFTFSLFNLFTGGGGGGVSSSSSESSHPLKQGVDQCAHHRRRCTAAATAGNTGNNNSHSHHHHRHHTPLGVGVESQRRNAAGLRLLQPNGRLSSQIKTRDSIRLTNQRKLRNNLMRGSNSCAELQKQTEESLELLLDFPANPGEELSTTTTTTTPQSSIDRSQSSYNIQRSQRKEQQNNNNHNTKNNPHLQINRSVATLNKPSQRLTKSVKFTMPDKVLIVPTNGRAGELSARSAALNAHQLPPADRQPPAPIIKRPVAKSSAYAQTEPNKSLYEMLAKYEGNTDLIVEINEKLKLTETIASPMSALDRPNDVCVADVNGPAEQESHLDHSDENNTNQQEQQQQQLEQMLLLASNVAEKPTELLQSAPPLSIEGQFNENDHVREENNYSNNGLNTTRQVESLVEPSDTNPNSVYCHPNRQSSTTTNSIQIEPDAEEAGFSQSWLQKQRAFV